MCARTPMSASGRSSARLPLPNRSHLILTSSSHQPPCCRRSGSLRPPRVTLDPEPQQPASVFLMISLIQGKGQAQFITPYCHCRPVNMCPPSKDLVPSVRPQSHCSCLVFPSDPPHKSGSRSLFGINLRDLVDINVLLSLLLHSYRLPRSPEETFFPVYGDQ